MPVSTQCVKPPSSPASGSTTSSAIDFVPSGIPSHVSSGETPSPWHVNLTGIGWLSANALEVSVKSPPPAAVAAGAAAAADEVGGSVVVVVVVVASSPLEPHAGS